MQSPHPRHGRSRRARRLAAGTAAALALAAPTPAPASASEGGHGTGRDPGRELTLTPADGGDGGGAAVGVRAVCEASGAGGVVSSPAFERTVALERAGGDRPSPERRATAALRPGLAVGGSYPVVAVCGTGELLSASFVHTGVTAGPGDGPSSAAPTAGGAAALAGLAGLAVGAVFLRRRGGGGLRRRRVSDRP
ncbi:hypothetical protein [Streptomyces sp. DH37]|uniref:hypothetical protein n=1 Tax=Streptomyces sp. DH37 TaxID=3040122 RepID=UPI002441CD80|nr:hypothetical protein [Streptomyces sp. DH37]MDG9702454.1 hypothetical protein [Streptomyces sp. DH37]